MRRQEGEFLLDSAYSLKSQPGVGAVGFTGVLPLSGHYAVSRAFSFDSHHNLHSVASLLLASVSPEYFAAVGTRLIAGSPPSDTNLRGQIGDCALSQSLADEFFPRENALNQLVYFSSFGRPDGTVLDPRAACRVVAIAENAKYISLRQPAPKTMYKFFDISYPSDYSDGTEAEVIVRATTDSLAFSALHAALTEAVPKAAIVTIQTFTERAHSDLSRERILVGLSGSFGVLALLLTGLGFYGLLARSVALRTREIGIRMALGASRRSIFVAIGRHVLLAAFIGLGAGLVVALALNVILSKLLDLRAGSIVAGCGSAIVLLCVVVVVAAAVPLRRTVSVDPMGALRME